MEPFIDYETRLEEKMAELAKQLPVYDWLQQPEQKGIGVVSLAKIVGECGSLSDYANPAKLWARMGLHPYTKNGITRMAKTWRGSKDVKLTAEDWLTYGRSPRRASIAYVISVGIVKQNGSGPYRARYEQVKAEHGYEKVDGKWAKVREGTKTKDSLKHVDNHARLLAVKLFVRELWNAWNGKSHEEHGWRLRN